MNSVFQHENMECSQKAKKGSIAVIRQNYYLHRKMEGEQSSVSTPQRPRAFSFFLFSELIFLEQFQAHNKTERKPWGFSIYSFPYTLHTCIASPQDQCHSLMTNTVDTSLLPKVHSSLQSSLLVLHILWVWTNT